MLAIHRRQHVQIELQCRITDHKHPPDPIEKEISYLVHESRINPCGWDLEMEIPTNATMTWVVSTVYEQPSKRPAIHIYISAGACSCARAARPACFNPLRTAVPLRGRITQIPSSLSPKRDCSIERVKVARTLSALPAPQSCSWPFL